MKAVVARQMKVQADQDLLLACRRSASVALLGGLRLWLQAVWLSKRAKLCFVECQRWILSWVGAGRLNEKPAHMNLLSLSCSVLIAGPQYANRIIELLERADTGQVLATDPAEVGGKGT